MTVRVPTPGSNKTSEVYTIDFREVAPLTHVGAASLSAYQESCEG